MIIICPECSTRYSIDQKIVEGQGKKVRCVQCEHIWKVMPETPKKNEGSEELELTDIVDNGAVDQDKPVKHELRQNQDPVGDYTSSHDQELNPSQPQPAVHSQILKSDLSRHDSLGKSSSSMNQRDSSQRPAWWKKCLGTVLITLMVLLVVVGAVGYFARSWIQQYIPKSTSIYKMLHLDQAETVLQITTHQPYRWDEKANGERNLTVSGTITNPSGQEVVLPRIVISLFDQSNKPIADWAFDPPQEKLKGLENMTFEYTLERVPSHAVGISVGLSSE